MNLPLTFSGVTIQIKEINNPKSKYIRELNAKVGDKLEMECILCLSRKQATEIRLTNISDENKPSVLLTQERFFGTFSLFNVEWEQIK